MGVLLVLMLLGGYFSNLSNFLILPILSNLPVLVIHSVIQHIE